MCVRDAVVADTALDFFVYSCPLLGSRAHPLNGATITKKRNGWKLGTAGQPAENDWMLSIHNVIADSAAWVTGKTILHLAV